MDKEEKRVVVVLGYLLLIPIILIPILVLGGFIINQFGY